MINDENRREVAQKLRDATLYTRGTPADWWMRLHEAVTGEDDFPSPAETMSVIANIIDRPTCKNASGYLDVFECSECRCRVDIVGENGNEYGDVFSTPFIPSFCPNCGAEVVE